MAEVLDETLTTKVEKPPNGKRSLERISGQRIPKKRRSPRRTASQAKKAVSGAQATSAAERPSVEDQHPGENGAAESGDSAPRKSGIERLINAIDKALAEDCHALAQKLVERARNGHESAMKLLIMLADRKKPRETPVKKPLGPTWSQRWAGEPLWQGSEKPQQGA